MKKPLKITGTTILLLPCLLILNESDTFLPNLIGAVWSICAVVIMNKKQIKP